MKKTLSAVLALLALVSCQENELNPDLLSSDNELYASIESVNATKTSMDENNNVLWSSGDQLIVFDHSTLRDRYQVNEANVGSITGGFSKVEDPEGGSTNGQDIDHLVAFYPYSDAVTCMKNDSDNPTQSYKLNVVLPSAQTYSPDTFGNGSFPMIAVSSSKQLVFKNVLGGIKLQFKGTDKIKSITLEGLGDELLSGNASVVGYVDGSVPVVTMSDGASASVTLDCGEGVQLSEDTPVTFIISVPPVEFASGMKITVTDTDGLSRTLTNSTPNTIKRSSLLTFPVITYSQKDVFEIPEGTLTEYEVLPEGGDVEIPIMTNQDFEVVIPDDAKDWITYVGTKAVREETIVLTVAENTTTQPRSADVLIATKEGVTLQSVTFSQEAGAYVPAGPDYIDEYGMNQGPSIEIDGVIWAPVNCGFHETDYPYGKLYQWGRKYGQGYDEEYTGIYDATYPTEENGKLVAGPVSISEGQSEANKDVFFSGYEKWWPVDTDYSVYRYLWNASGSTEEMIKSENDPCPQGWRVPTAQEHKNLIKNHSQWTTHDGQNGYWFSGATPYANSSPRVFFSAVGDRANAGFAYNRTYIGCYWDADMSDISFDKDRVSHASPTNTARGHAVRCVKDTSVPSEEDAVDLSENATANSYIVSASGRYKFTPTKGNSDDSVGSIASVNVLWESFGTDVVPNVGDLIYGVEYKNGSIFFQTPEAFKEGNAVIVAKDNSNAILWSWHIWLTDQPEEQVYYNNAGTMMDRNLGATSVTHGDVCTFGLFYQWGRKDPFLGVSSLSGSVRAKSTISWPSPVESDSNYGTVEYATKNPTTFITEGTSDTDDWHYASRNNDLWASEKTIYDPCPAGWRVPDGGPDSIWAVALGSSNEISNYPFDSANMGLDFAGKLGDASSIWYPVPGYIRNNYGTVDQVGRYASYLSVTPVNNMVRPFDIDQYGWIVPSYDAVSRAGGNSVRCAKDEDISSVPFINLSETSVTVSAEGLDAYSINVSSNVDELTVSVPDADASWIEASLNENQVVISISANSGSERSSIIKIVSSNDAGVYADIRISQEGVPEFNSAHCLYYKANITGGWDNGMNNYRATRSYLTFNSGGKVIEMKFKLNALGNYDDAHLLCGSNLAKDSCDEFKVTKTYLMLSVDYSDDEWYSYTWKWEDLGVSQTDLITLRFSGIDETITINDKVLSCKGITYLSGAYLFSSYFREYDEGEWKEYSGLPEGSEIYYVKAYDADGELTYIGHAAKAQNPQTGRLEGCWFSNLNGTIKCQFANDALNQGGYTVNF